MEEACEGSSGAAHRKATLGRARGGAMRPCGGRGEARRLGLSAGEGEGKRERFGLREGEKREGEEGRVLGCEGGRREKERNPSGLGSKLGQIGQK